MWSRRRISLAAHLTSAVIWASGCSGSNQDDSLKLQCSKGSDGCTCSAYVNGSPPDTSLECSPQAFPGTACCADEAWPSGSPSTICQCKESYAGSNPAACAHPISECSLSAMASSSSSTTGSGTGGGSSGTGGPSSTCSGQGVKDYCNASDKSGVVGSDCCAGLFCSNGAFRGVQDNPYDYRCSQPGCQPYHGSCNKDEDCCGAYTCSGNLCD